MEHDNQQLCLSTIPVISRLDRLDRLLQHFEKKQSCSSLKCSTPIMAEEKLDQQCKRLSSALEEVDSKGTLMERLEMLENRVLQLSLQTEDGNMSSSSTSTKTDAENNAPRVPADLNMKFINSLEQQDQIIIPENDFKEATEGANQKKGRRRKKTPSFNHNKRRFGWFHMGC
ncbi:Vacuolar iron transporter family protein [Thalictrum thalictroides]|uniref:Vacuolar iron transporter family protein n=1 Tax=Thalictrum thalictroides TaxID=46969 RepID=A0A7J6V9S3_THATH|nr:Vacuolar iron transporter family protein [Thalictrum thalictroides]